MAAQDSQSLPTASSRSSPAANSTLDHAQNHQHDAIAASNNAVAPVPTKKSGKNKKVADPNETGKLLAAKISQLELDAAGEKDQEAEIGKVFFFLGCLCRLHTGGSGKQSTNSR